MPDTRKLYCYVDETGQDTLGRLFIVAIVITDERQYSLESSLEAIEQEVGKKSKWMKSSDSVRLSYLRSVHKSKVSCTLYAKDFPSAEAGFDRMEVLATAQAINLYRESNKIGEYKATIVIDGQSKTMLARMGADFRKLGVKTRKVVGKRDQSSAIVRLADAVAGLKREAKEGRKEYIALEARLKRAKLLRDL